MPYLYCTAQDLQCMLPGQTEDTGHAKAKVVPAVVTKLKHENGVGATRFATCSLELSVACALTLA
eukprot:34869-Eustigmatos_ZCMA.PRE.1